MRSSFYDHFYAYKAIPKAEVYPKKYEEFDNVKDWKMNLSRIVYGSNAACLRLGVLPKFFFDRMSLPFTTSLINFKPFMGY